MNEPLVITRVLHLAATLLLTGTLAFRWLMVVGEGPAGEAKAGSALHAALRGTFARMIWAALAATVASGAAWLVLLSAEIGDVGAAAAVSQGWPWLVLTDTAFGNTWMVRFAVAVLLAVVLPALRGASSAEGITGAIPVLLAAALAASLAWTGHAAGMEGIDGVIHLTSDALHLLAAGAWLGALWPLALLLRAADRAGDPASAAIAYAATRRFSAMGVVCVGVIAVSGAVNTYEILGLSAFSLGTPYNRLLLAKIALFLGMLAVAAVNRLRLTPRLAGGGDPRAMRQLRRNSLTETAFGVMILLIVAVLGRMTPHM